MLVSTRGRYALRFMIYLAARGASAPVALREASEAEGISVKYLEQLARSLQRAGLVRGTRGKGGGYALALPAGQILAGDVLRAVEGSTAPVACVAPGGACERSERCAAARFWEGLDRAIERYVDGVTLADLAALPSAAPEQARP